MNFDIFMTFDILYSYNIALYNALGLLIYLFMVIIINYIIRFIRILYIIINYTYLISLSLPAV